MSVPPPSQPNTIDRPSGSVDVPASAMNPPGTGPSRKDVKDQIIERFEQKYVIHPYLVPKIREYIKPFCIPDPNGKGRFPEYTVTTLQIDSANMDLCRAKENKEFGRFKLRIRTYGIEAKQPIFFEIKRKVNGVVIKSRAKMTQADYKPGMIYDHRLSPVLKSAKDNTYYLEFCRLARQLNAQPKMLIRYIRESYFGANDDYARLTFDRRVSYLPTRSWNMPGPEVTKWRPMDTQAGLNRPYAGYIFELKSMRDTPTWMLELVERFNLRTCGFCKYATAWRLESIYRGYSYTAQSENVSINS